MKPLILTAMTVIGLFGIIGTVEYLEAQTTTILNIEPEGIAKGTNILNGEIHITMIRSYADETYRWINGGNVTHGNSPNNQTGNFYWIKLTNILPNPLFKNFDPQCGLQTWGVKELIATGRSPLLKAPTNIAENNTNIIAIGLDLFNGTKRATQNTPCIVDLEAKSNHPITTERGVYFTLYNQANKKPYYFEPRENILEAQPIPACSNDNFDTTTKTLKGDTKMCYGKNSENDMMVVTKKLFGFYGATEQFVITEYQKLLQRLYLPAI